MTATRAALIALTLLLVACTSPPHDVRGEREPFAPPDDPAALSPVERLGYEIHLHDQAAWLATEEALAQGLLETGAVGWITVEQDFGTVLVRFVGPCDDDPEAACAHVDVTVGATPIVLKPSPPEPLPDAHVAAWRARQIALASGFRACTARTNTVVLPDVHESAAAWRVYLIATSTEPDEVVLAGHHRITVSGDGRQLLRAEPLSQGCLVIEPDPRAEALFVTHVLDPAPIETHVFTSLDYRMPLVVGTESGLYRVEGTSIRLERAR